MEIVLDTILLDEMAPGSYVLQVGNGNVNSFVEFNWVLLQSWSLAQRLVAQWTLTGARKGSTRWAVLNLLVGPFQRG